MKKVILGVVVSGILAVGGFPVLAEEPRASREEVAKPQLSVEQELTTSAAMRRRGLKPLSDDELDQITAAGIGPIIHMLPPYVFSPGYFQPHIIKRRFPMGLNLNSEIMRHRTRR